LACVLHDAIASGAGTSVVIDCYQYI